MRQRVGADVSPDNSCIRVLHTNRRLHLAPLPVEAPDSDFHAALHQNR